MSSYFRSQALHAAILTAIGLTTPAVSMAQSSRPHLAPADFTWVEKFSEISEGLYSDFYELQHIVHHPKLRTGFKQMLLHKKITTILELSQKAQLNVDAISKFIPEHALNSLQQDLEQLRYDTNHGRLDQAARMIDYYVAHLSTRVSAQAINESQRRVK